MHGFFYFMVLSYYLIRETTNQLSSSALPPAKDYRYTFGRLIYPCETQEREFFFKSYFLNFQISFQISQAKSCGKEFTLRKIRSEPFAVDCMRRVFVHVWDEEFRFYAYMSVNKCWRRIYIKTSVCWSRGGGVIRTCKHFRSTKE